MNEKQARKRVRELRSFFSHLMIFSIVNVMLIILNVLTSPEELWFIWPLLSWGIGLLAHAAQVFGFFGIGTRGWEDRKVRELMEQNVSIDQVRGMVTRELKQVSTPPSAEELLRLRQRVEHLEAIVTSRDWDILEAGYRAEPEAGPPAAEGPAGEPTPQERAAELARRVR